MMVNVNERPEENRLRKLWAKHSSARTETSQREEWFGWDDTATREGYINRAHEEALKEDRQRLASN